MSSFFSTTLSGKSKGDRSTKRSTTRSSATSSSSASQNNPTSPTELAFSTPFHRLPQNQPPPVAGPSQHTGYTTTNGRKEEAASKGVASSPTRDSDPRRPPTDSGEGHDIRQSAAEFGGHNPYSGNAAGSSKTPRRGSETGSMRSLASTIHRPNDELGRYPSLGRVTPTPTFKAVPNGRSTTSLVSGYHPGASTTSLLSVNQQSPPPANMPLSSMPSPSSTSYNAHGSKPPPPSTSLPPISYPASMSREASSPQSANTPSRSSSLAPSVISTPGSTHSTPTATPTMQRPPSSQSVYRSQSQASNYTTGKAPSIISMSRTNDILSLSTRNDEFCFPRPSDAQIEDLFAELVENRDLDHNNAAPVPTVSSRHSTQSVASAVARTTSTLSVNTKWQMVEADARARWERKKRDMAKEEEAVRRGQGRKSAAALSRDSPQYIIRKVLVNQLTKQHLSTLNVSLRTQPLDWIRDFMDLKGQVVLANYLNTLTHRRSKGGIDVDMEFELLKCLKRSLSNKVGPFYRHS